MNAILAKKLHMTTRFDAKGTRYGVTVLSAEPNVVVAVRNQEKDGYDAVQLGLGSRKHTNKPLAGHVKKANLEKAPQYIREWRASADQIGEVTAGTEVKVTDVVKPGDLLKISGISKGKGFQGGMKRWGFHGGPASHGQSDRSRAPGSIGSGTTPGRVYKGKKMAGKMGNDTVSVKNLEVFTINEADNTIEVIGAVPGFRTGLLFLEVIGENKKHVGPVKVEEELAEPVVEENLEAAVEAGAEEVLAEPEEAETPAEEAEEVKEEETEDAKA